MLELPGLTSSGDLGKDLDGLKRYIARLVPALEIELINAGQDDYQAEYSAQKQGIGASDKKSTAGALVAHELRQDNPHRVTAAQLGLTLDRLVSITFTQHGLSARIGEKRGLQINIENVIAEVTSWRQIGGTAWAEADLGSWDAEMPLLYGATTTLTGGLECWAGALTGSTGKLIGTIRLHRGCTIDVSDNANNSGTIAEEMMIPLTVIGWGVFGYGD